MPATSPFAQSRPAPRRGSAHFTAVLLFASLLPPLLAPASASSQTKPAKRHTVSGLVTSATDKPLSGAVVYLENVRSLDVQSYLSDDQGRYHFNHITPQTDYEVWAEQNGVESKHHWISQFSSHTDFHFTLKVAPGRKKFLGIF